ncbi:beta-amylase 2, chloroplastic-like isoform X2 [Papaver somniferum]|uniref:beta-amylase 2, chloroplastic-like isoform X2 n=1 Tax=Papaver somniferum TaxID=3469 RepID=UPI000E70425D|nr:beta-amylase 2, chloroplastic-like isoform X2 [Papaver somniferum]
MAQQHEKFGPFGVVTPMEHHHEDAEEEEDEEDVEMRDEAEEERNGNSNNNTPSTPTTAGGGIRRSRPKEEKERTKLRERHRRAITAKILTGLRRHGNYNLRVRADINDVIASLAREAGWVVLPDGTTFPSASSSSQATKPVTTVTNAAALMITSNQMGGGGTAPVTPSIIGVRNLVDHRSAGRMKTVFVPSNVDVSTSRSSTIANAVVGDQAGEKVNDDSPALIDGCMEVVDVKDMNPDGERDFASSPYVPVYVMLPLGIINSKSELVDPDGLLKQLRTLKSINVDGVMVDCWWGIVEAHAPQEYNWYGYKRLFQLVRDLNLKLQVVLSFHECGGNVGDDVCIPLPHWVAEVGRNNPDIFFTDKEGRRNPECLSWGIDKERVLRGRTAVEVYFDYMRSFRVEFDEFFQQGVISEIEVGLGPCGELRYPSYPVKHGWRYPGIGEFQCYDKYLMKNLTNAAEARGHSFWAHGPENAGCYTSQPHETGFFCDGGDYDSYYGRFFLNWYSQILIEHADRVLSLAKLAFEGTSIAVKLSGVHWWYKTASHAAELTAGFYNSCNRDGYSAIAAMLKKHEAALNFTCVELRTLDQAEDFPEALADPEGLVWQVLNAAWDASIPVASENALVCYDREGYNKILENAKPLNDPDGRHLVAFTYLRLSSYLMEEPNFEEFAHFVKKMHGTTSI